tara:strand:- start:31984 stop:32613 length:630 start_codon:yes stop_codon:yes gene_type:complete
MVGAGFLASGVPFSAIEGRVEQLGTLAPVGFVLISILMMSVLLPKTVVSLAAGALFGTAFGSALMLVIAVAAAVLNYSIGRWWLHESVLARIQAADDLNPKSRKLLSTAHDLARDAGFGFHLLIRLAPVPTMVISYMMGAGGAKLRPFVSAAAVAVIPQTLWVHSGSVTSLIHDQNATVAQWTGIALSLVAAIGISVLVPREVMRRIRL